MLLPGEFLDDHTVHKRGTCKKCHAVDLAAGPYGPTRIGWQIPPLGKLWDSTCLPQPLCVAGSVLEELNLTDPADPDTDVQDKLGVCMPCAYYKYITAAALDGTQTESELKYNRVCTTQTNCIGDADKKWYKATTKILAVTCEKIPVGIPLVATDYFAASDFTT